MGLYSDYALSEIALTQATYQFNLDQLFKDARVLIAANDENGKVAINVSIVNPAGRMLYDMTPGAGIVLAAGETIELSGLVIHPKVTVGTFHK